MVSNLEQVARRRETNRVTMETRMAIKLIAVPQARNNAAYGDMIISMWKDCPNNPYSSCFTGSHFSVIRDRERASANEAKLDDKTKGDKSARKSTRSKHHTKRRPKEVHTNEESFRSKPGGPMVKFEKY